MKFLALINEASGGVMKFGAGTIEETVRRVLADQEHKVDVEIAGCQAIIECAAKRADDYDAMIVAGGDGTQAAIAGALGSARCALLPLPCGTMNLLCRDLGIPLTLEEAVATALAAPVEAIDIGIAGERAFLNNIVFGSYAELAEAREEIREMESFQDFSFAVVSAAHSLLHADPIRFHLEVDSKPVDVKTNTIVVSLNRITHAENMVPHRERLSDGALVVYLTDAKDGRDLANIILSFAQGAADESRQIIDLECEKCIVGAGDKAFSYTVDGDPLDSEKPLVMKIRKKALKVFYPRLASRDAGAADE